MDKELYDKIDKPFKDYNYLVSKITDYIMNYKNIINKDLLENYNYLNNYEEQFIICFMDINEIDNEYYSFVKDIIVFKDSLEYSYNPYIKNITFDGSYNNITFNKEVINSLEGFFLPGVNLNKYERIPKLGVFLNSSLEYPIIYEDNKEWMSLIPNEIDSMKDDINNSCGNVLVLGLGLGYYTYMISLKEDVKSITVIENDERIIDFFNKYLAKYFNMDKIHIINSDGIEYIKNNNIKEYDYIFIDIYRDVSDGIFSYLELKKYDLDNNMHFWIEEDIFYYIKSIFELIIFNYIDGINIDIPNEYIKLVSLIKENINFEDVFNNIEYYLDDKFIMKVIKKYK